MARWAASAAAPAKNEPVSGAESLFGAMTWAGDPKLNPVVGVFAAVKLEKKDDVAESGFEGLGAGDGVAPGFRLPNGELAKVENGEFWAWFDPAPLRAKAAKGLAVVGGVDGVTLRLRPLVLDVPRTLGLMGVVAVDGLGPASLGCGLATLEARL